ncbi:hypothetical protein CDV31_007322 [Fusarium ambrosium]|uniref:DUF2293 domain-containing protein n=1 Tax=Fusarium ambrosium TaxID=131363 RepID=A0A428U7I9_9HYPO|nr:hypothetical protein CDV31_007322 [Fusarium ambrosium]
MGREKRGLPAAVAGGPKERHRRAQRSQYDPAAPVPQGFVAKPAIPKTKHHSYFEFVENKDKKKKKLEFQITTKNTPPPGFEFVPAGNPELTTACKELSRDKDAMIFIVSNAKDNTTNILSHQVHRVGHHIRETIVEEARASLGHILDRTLPQTGGSPEPIPKSQEEYDAQVDAALRDLFPRIPNTDRQMIIEHAFRKGTSSKTEKVGLSTDITLARRVQLAVLAHIRHTHTSGRDQLDEILREVVVISDSEEESGEETDDSVEEVMPQPRSTLTNRLTSNISGQDGPGRRQSPRLNPGTKGPLTPAKQKAKVKKAKRKTSAERKGQRGFKRYQAWQEALERSRGEPAPAPQSPPVARSLPYTHVPPPTGLALRDDEFPPASQLRIVPERAGPAPNENGYFGKPHHPPSNQFMNPRRESFSPVARKVKSPFNESSPVTRRPVSRITSRLQDMLVPSIEPASPEAMKPSFIRTVPPRPQALRDELPFGSRIQHPSTVSSPLRGLDVRDDPAHISRPDRFAPEDRPYDGRLNGPGQGVLHREQDYAPRNGSRIVTAPLYRSDARPALHTPPAIAVSRRPYEEAPIPGSRDSPIVMEDRGGFYQRVPVRGDGTRLAAHDPGFVEYRRPTRETQRVEEPRPMSWHEGPRVLHDGRHGAGIEVIPITRALPLEARPRPILVESRSAPYLPAVSVPPSGSWRYVEREPHLVHHDTPSSETRLMMSDHPGLRREPYREIRIEERPLEAFQQREPIQRHYETQPLAPNNGRTHPLHPRQPENVIVLE